MYQIINAPTANAERFTSMPKKSPNEKKVKSLRQKPPKYCRSVVINSSEVLAEKDSPKINEVNPTKTVDKIESTPTIMNLDNTNSDLLSPSMRFCFSVLFEYSLETIDTITNNKKNLKIAATHVVKCQIYGNSNIPCSANLIGMGPMLKLIEEIAAIEAKSPKYTIINTLLARLYFSLRNSMESNLNIG